MLPETTLMWQRFLETGALVLLGLGAIGFLGWLLWNLPGANGQDLTRRN